MPINSVENRAELPKSISWVLLMLVILLTSELQSIRAVCTSTREIKLLFYQGENGIVFKCLAVEP